jgi:hypothetical protein
MVVPGCCVQEYRLRLSRTGTAAYSSMHCCNNPVSSCPGIGVGDAVGTPQNRPFAGSLQERHVANINVI